jgi:molecular chaperone DnaK
MAFLSDAPPPPDDGVVIEPESLEAPDLDLPPLSKPPASQKPPQVVAIESELEAFLLEDRTMPSASTAIASVVDQPAPPPLPNRGSPTLPSQVSRPSQTGMPAQTAHPAPVISERQSASPAPLSGPPRGASTSPLLIDVTPLSLGVETVGGFCDIIIRANSPVPCDRSRIFRTASDNQTAVVVKVCQGESDRFLENTTLGDLRLSGFRAAPRGEVEISVTFEIDADGILNVQAKETSTGRSAVARIELLGAHMDPKKMQAMIERQARREVA